MARHTTYDPELATAICNRMQTGEPLNVICKEPGMPAESTVRGWALDDRDGFSAVYARAKELQAHALAEQVLSLAASATAENWQQVRLQVDAHKWYASKTLPKSYGDKVTSEITGANGAPLIPVLNVKIERNE